MPLYPIFDDDDAAPVAEQAAPTKLQTNGALDEKDTFLPFGFPAPEQERERPSVDHLLALGGCRGGPSKPLGWSSLKEARNCLRWAYWRLLRGLYTDGTEAMNLGKVVHACLEAYATRGDGWRVVALFVNDYPEMAQEAGRLFRRYLLKYEQLDADFFDIRAVEVPSQFWFPSRKVGNKKRRLGVSARADLAVRRKGREEGRLEPGACAEQLELHDFKTISALSSNATRAFEHDGQLLQNLLCWEGTLADEGGHPLDISGHEIYGKAVTYGITHIGKAQRDYGDGGCSRISIAIPRGLVDEYKANTQDWLYDEFGARWYSEHREKPETWPKSYLCRCPITHRTCPFIVLCESGGRMDPRYAFQQRPEPLPLEAFEYPETKREKRTRLRRKSVAEAEGK